MSDPLEDVAHLCASSVRNNWSFIVAALDFVPAKSRLSDTLAPQDSPWQRGCLDRGDPESVEWAARALRCGTLPTLVFAGKCPVGLLRC